MMKVVNAVECEKCSELMLVGSKTYIKICGDIFVGDDKLIECNEGSCAIYCIPCFLGVAHRIKGEIVYRQ